MAPSNMTSWHSYPKVYNLGHRALTALFDGPVIIEEKVDGSQFSFGRFDGELKLRSHGRELYEPAIDAMFRGAVDAVKELDLHDGWTYRGEVLARPHHNILAYDRVPKGNVILFDINTAEETYLPYDRVYAEAERIGLEVVPLLGGGVSPRFDADYLLSLLATTSILGGQTVEGIVVKNYTQFGVDGKVVMGKFVSESFKEVKGGEWRKANPTTNDQVEAIIERYKTPARWHKAVQHLHENGGIEESTRDIGPLLKEVHDDLEAECADEIRELLFKHFWPKIARGVAAGFPEWYKEQLLQLQFSREDEDAEV